jgi:hypothetical protein
VTRCIEPLYEAHRLGGHGRESNNWRWSEKIVGARCTALLVVGADINDGDSSTVWPPPVDLQ